jgi:hypothetical protein
MNRIFRSIITASVMMCSAFAATAQQKGEPRQAVGCQDPVLRSQADDIKKHFTAQGFTVYRDAMINMESMVPFPVMVQFQRGQLYEIIFVGQQAATNHRMVIYDGSDHKVDEKFVFKRGNSKDVTNYMVYEFVPERSDTYLLEFMTRLKNKEFCGSLCIVAVDRSKGEVKYTPYVAE